MNRIVQSQLFTMVHIRGKQNGNIVASNIFSVTLPIGA